MGPSCFRLCQLQRWPTSTQIAYRHQLQRLGHEEPFRRKIKYRSGEKTQFGGALAAGLRSGRGARRSLSLAPVSRGPTKQFPKAASSKLSANPTGRSIGVRRRKLEVRLSHVDARTSVSSSRRRLRRFNSKVDAFSPGFLPPSMAPPVGLAEQAQGRQSLDAAAQPRSTPNEDICINQPCGYFQPPTTIPQNGRSARAQTGSHLRLGLSHLPRHGSCANAVSRQCHSN